MPLYYHCTPHENLARVLRDGIKPGREIGISRTDFGLEVDNNFLYLWKNLGILDGLLCKDLLETGYDFLQVEVPESHSIERDLDTKIILESHPELLVYLMKPLGIAFAPSDYLGKEKIEGLARNVLSLPKEQQEMALVELICKEIARDRAALNQILEMPSQENWDRIIGFYRTRTPIPNSPPYKLKSITIN